MAEGTETLIIGNGDVTSYADGLKKADASGAHGVMVGRGVFGNPWFFNTNNPKESVSLVEQLRVMVEHTRLFEEKLGDIKNFAIMRKHYSAYIRGFAGARELRTELMNVTSTKEVEKVIEDFLDA
jgi:tRNA-dihydrouridine synthase